MEGLSTHAKEKADKLAELLFQHGNAQGMLFEFVQAHPRSKDPAAFWKYCISDERQQCDVDLPDTYIRVQIKPTILEDAPNADRRRQWQETLSFLEEEGYAVLASNYDYDLLFVITVE